MTNSDLQFLNNYLDTLRIEYRNLHHENFKTHIVFFYRLGKFLDNQCGITVFIKGLKTLTNIHYIKQLSSILNEKLVHSIYLIPKNLQFFLLTVLVIYINYRKQIKKGKQIVFDFFDEFIIQLARASFANEEIISQLIKLNINVQYKMTKDYEHLVSNTFIFNLT